MNVDALLSLICFPFELFVVVWTLCYIFKTNGFDANPEDFDDDDFLKPID
jgi:hypothetical protein